jgi:circadian clock protein KaiB
MRRSKAQSATKAFEDALAAEPLAAHYQLRLFISGSTARSSRAIQSIRALCEEKLQGRYDLEVIDIFQHPEEVKPEQIVVTPTLVKKLPLPFRKIIGDLSDKERVLVGLSLSPVELPAKTPKGSRGA